MPISASRRPLAAALLLLLAAACTDAGPTEPLPPPDHDLLFESAVEGAPRLRLLRLAAGAPITLAPGLMARDPAPSPGGLWIAFVVEDIRAYEVDIWVVHRDGSGLRRLTDHWEVDDQPVWSPDGRSLVFRRSAPGVGSDLMIVPATGGTARRLSLAGEQRHPAWSPDGTLIAFVYQPAFNRGQPEIQTVRPDGTDLRTRTSDPGWGGGLNPSWIRR